MTTPLRNFALAAALATGVMSESAGAEEPLKISGFARSALTEGKDGKPRDEMPNLVLNTGDKIKFSAAFDVYDPDGTGPNGHRGRLFWLNATTKMDCGALGNGSASLGMQQPFFSTKMPLSQNGLLPMINADSAITLNPGFTGVNLNCTRKFGDTALSTQAYLGTRSSALNRDFGAESGPGYDSPIYGGGASIAHKFNNGLNAESGYRLTEFAEGPSGTNRTLHFAYATANGQLGETAWRIYGEAAESIISSPRGETSSLNTTLYAEARVPLNHNFTLRSIGAFVNGKPITEILYVWRPNQDWSAQIGASHSFADDETTGGITLAKAF